MIKVIKTENIEGSDQYVILRRNKDHQLSITRIEAIRLIENLSDALWGEKKDG
jgi:hypothetical protein